MKKYIGPILSIATVGMLFYTLLDLKNQVKDLKAQVKVEQEKNLAMHDSLFITNVQLNRYIIAYDILVERNPKAAGEYDAILSHETE